MLFQGRLFHAPIRSPQFVLDIRTGTGRWAIEFGKPPSQLTSQCKADIPFSRQEPSMQGKSRYPQKKKK